jgi:Kdo2-lipid IVA lauroyltransferase/acyltransferase
VIDAGDPRRVYETLRAGGWVCMLADQDARGAGVFVPFFGRPASTPAGPARIALKAGAPIVMGFVTRRADGRLALDLEPALERPAADDPDPVRTLTARHTAQLERRVRMRPEQWFWLHRRWKTRPPAEAAAPAARAGAASPPPAPVPGRPSQPWEA